MKAYHVTDRKGYSDYSVIVFAENRGKAISSALGTDEFPQYDWEFTDLTARRVPALDKAYHGCWRMEWYDDDDRLAMIKDAGFYCDEDSFDPRECEECIGKDYCSRYEEFLEEEQAGDGE